MRLVSGWFASHTGMNQLDGTTGMIELKSLLSVVFVLIFSLPGRDSRKPLRKMENERFMEGVAGLCWVNHSPALYLTYLRNSGPGWRRG